MPALREGLSTREREILALIAEGASDKAIAGKLFLSINTVKWHNRQIYQKLGVKSRREAAVRATEQDLLEGSSELTLSFPKIGRHNLPVQLTSFIGRSDEINLIQELLNNHRLVTLTGPGGVGKTRLALELAKNLVNSNKFPDGIYFIELAVLSEPDRIPRYILENLEISNLPGETPLEVLSRYLLPRSLLLVLDNFEHLMNGANLVLELLSLASNISILCTSRERLNLSGEQIYPVKELLLDNSVELFGQRVKEIQPLFLPDVEEIDIIKEICIQLDNLPLAIELAASRMDMFDLRKLSDGLQNRFQILTKSSREVPDRHKTLRKTIEWSFDLLNEEEKILLYRLAVFQGSRTIDAVQEVCCFDIGLNAIDGLSSLLSKNLIEQEIGYDQEPRFFLLETLHEFTAELFQQSGEEDQIRHKHAFFFITLVEQAREPLRGGPLTIIWQRKIDADFENIRLAHEWTILQGDDISRLRLVEGLTYYLHKMRNFIEGMDWIKGALKIVDIAPLDIQAGIYMAAAIMNFYNRNHELCMSYSYKSLRCYQETEDDLGIASCHVGILAALEGNADSEEIHRHFGIAKDIYSEACDKIGLNRTWFALGAQAHRSQDYELAYDCYLKALPLAEESEDVDYILKIKVNLAGVKAFLGDGNTSRNLMIEVLREELSLYPSHSTIYGTLECLASSENALDRPERAVTLISAANSFRNPKEGEYIHIVHDRERNSDLKRASEMLDESDFAEAWEKGQKMSVEEAIAFAFDENAC